MNLSDPEAKVWALEPHKVCFWHADRMKDAALSRAGYRPRDEGAVWVVVPAYASALELDYAV